MENTYPSPRKIGKEVKRTERKKLGKKENKNRFWKLGIKLFWVLRVRMGDDIMWGSSLSVNSVTCSGQEYENSEIQKRRWELTSLAKQFYEKINYWEFYL